MNKRFLLTLLVPVTVLAMEDADDPIVRAVGYYETLATPKSSQVDGTSQQQTALDLALEIEKGLKPTQETHVIKDGESLSTFLDSLGESTTEQVAAASKDSTKAEENSGTVVINNVANVQPPIVANAEPGITNPNFFTAPTQPKIVEIDLNESNSPAPSDLASSAADVSVSDLAELPPAHGSVNENMQRLDEAARTNKNSIQLPAPVTAGPEVLMPLLDPSVVPAPDRSSKVLNVILDENGNATLLTADQINELKAQVTLDDQNKLPLSGKNGEAKLANDEELVNELMGMNWLFEEDDSNYKTNSDAGISRKVILITKLPLTSKAKLSWNKTSTLTKIFGGTALAVVCLAILTGKKVVVYTKKKLFPVDKESDNQPAIAQ